MDISQTIPTEQASKVRPVLLRVALFTALFFAVMLLLDCFVKHQIVLPFIESEWYVLFAYWWLLTYFLAVLLGALRDMVLPASRAWSKSEHLNFTVIFCIFGFFVMPTIYFVAIFMAIEPNHVSGGG